jgi:hypothetical protein
MNIFVLDEDPVKSAQAMDCVRVPKMVTESAQMMASALLRHGAPKERMPLTKSRTAIFGGLQKSPMYDLGGRYIQLTFDWLCRHARLGLCH